MITRIQKWGNSLALRIPKSFAVEAGLKQNASVQIILQDGKLVVLPLPEKPNSLDDLLAEVTEQNLHHEFNTGSAVGNEAW